MTRSSSDWLFVTPNIALRLVACHFEIMFTNQGGRTRGGEGKKGAAMHRPFPERRPAHNKRLILGGSGWIDRFDADRSSGGVENSSHLHALVDEALSLLLVVELIGGPAVSGGKDKFVPRFYNRSVKRLLRSRIHNRRLIVRLHGLLLSCRIGRGVGSTLRQRRLACETQGNSQRHRGQGELYFLHRTLLADGSVIRVRRCKSPAKQAPPAISY